MGSAASVVAALVLCQFVVQSFHWRTCRSFGGGRTCIVSLSAQGEEGNSNEIEELLKSQGIDMDDILLLQKSIVDGTEEEYEEEEENGDQIRSETSPNEIEELLKSQGIDMDDILLLQKSIVDGTELFFEEAEEEEEEEEEVERERAEKSAANKAKSAQKKEERLMRSAIKQKQLKREVRPIRDRPPPTTSTTIDAPQLQQQRKFIANDYENEEMNAAITTAIPTTSKLDKRELRPTGDRPARESSTPSPSPTPTPSLTVYTPKETPKDNTYTPNLVQRKDYENEDMNRAIRRPTGGESFLTPSRSKGIVYSI